MLANRSGADLVIDAGESAHEEVREAPTVSGRTWSWASWGPTFFGIPYAVSVQTTYGGNRAELVEVLDLAARGLLHAEITRFELDQAEHAYEQLGSGAVDGRVVVVPNGA